MLEITPRKSKGSKVRRIVTVVLGITVIVVLVGKWIIQTNMYAPLVDGTYHLMQSNPDTEIAFMDDSQVVQIEGDVLKIDDGTGEKEYQVDSENRKLLGDGSTLNFTFGDDTLRLSSIELQYRKIFVRVGSEKYQRVQDGKVQYKINQ